MKFSEVRNTWYTKLFSLIASGVGVSNCMHLFSNVSVVSFNYDRSLEYFLLHAIRTYYGCTLEEAADTLRTLPILHPYGLVGELNGLTREHGGVPYGDTGCSRIDLLRTYTEQIEDEKLLSDIKTAVAESERIIFLGFGFHEQNIKLLSVDTKDKFRNVFGTAIGISHADQTIICSKLERNGIVRGNIYLRDLSCSDLFDEYSRTFSYAA
jgi:hypothetical protein